MAEVAPSPPPSAPGAPPPKPRIEVTPAKLKGVRELLARDGEVRFNNGALMTRSKHGGVIVNRRPGRVCQIERPFGSRSLEAAYDYAVNGETEEEKARRPRRKPFWFNPDKLRPDRPEWEECPF